MQKQGIIPAILLISLLAAGSCKKSDNNVTHTRNYYGTTYNIRNDDTLESFHTRISVKESKSKVVFASSQLDKANITFDKANTNSYQSNKLNEVYDVQIRDTMLHFNFTKQYPAGAYHTFLFQGTQQ